MKKYCFAVALCYLATVAFAQQPTFTVIKNNPATSVKSQQQSGTCWDFSSTALVESELLLQNKPETDISETFTMYNLYLDKAEKYIRRRGDTRFSGGGIEQDMIFSTDTYGAIPQSIYPGVGRDTVINHDSQIETKVKAYLNRVLKNNPDTIPSGWEDSVRYILNSYLGAPPATFTFNGKEYTPKTYAAENITVKLSDYLGLTSFTHHPYYTNFSIEVPDNYNSNMFFNLPLDEFIAAVKAAIMNGYTVGWDTDVSNDGFKQRVGVAKWVDNKQETKNFLTFTEQKPNAAVRQKLFDDQVTQDDHLMQITGLAKDANGNEYFIVKNSWGNIGPYKGYIYVSMPYFTINTISVLIDKKALPASMLAKAAE